MNTIVALLLGGSAYHFFSVWYRKNWFSYIAYLVGFWAIIHGALLFFQDGVALIPAAILAGLLYWEVVSGCAGKVLTPERYHLIRFPLDKLWEGVLFLSAIGGIYLLHYWFYSASMFWVWAFLFLVIFAITLKKSWIVNNEILLIFAFLILLQTTVFIATFGLKIEAWSFFESALTITPYFLLVIVCCFFLFETIFDEEKLRYLSVVLWLSGLLLVCHLPVVTDLMVLSDITTLWNVRLPLLILGIASLILGRFFRFWVLLITGMLLIYFFYAPLFGKDIQSALSNPLALAVLAILSSLLSQLSNRVSGTFNPRYTITKPKEKNISPDKVLAYFSLLIACGVAFTSFVDPGLPNQWLSLLALFLVLISVALVSGIFKQSRYLFLYIPVTLFFLSLVFTITSQILDFQSFSLPEILMLSGTGICLTLFSIVLAERRFPSVSRYLQPIKDITGILVFSLSAIAYLLIRNLGMIHWIYFSLFGIQYAGLALYFRFFSRNRLWGRWKWVFMASIVGILFCFGLVVIELLPIIPLNVTTLFCLLAMIVTCFFVFSEYQFRKGTHTIPLRRFTFSALVVIVIGWLIPQLFQVLFFPGYTFSVNHYYRHAFILVLAGLAILRLSAQGGLRLQPYLGMIALTSAAFFLVGSNNALYILVVSHLIYFFTEKERLLASLIRKTSKISNHEWLRLRSVLQYFCLLFAHVSVLLAQVSSGGHGLLELYCLLLAGLWFHQAHYRKKVVYFYFTLAAVVLAGSVGVFQTAFLQNFPVSWLYLSLFIGLTPFYHFYLKKRFSIHTWHLYAFLTTSAAFVLFHVLKTYEYGFNSNTTILLTLWLSSYLIPYEKSEASETLDLFLRCQFFIPGLILFFAFKASLLPIIYLIGAYVTVWISLMLLRGKIALLKEKDALTNFGVFRHSLQLSINDDRYVFWIMPALVNIVALGLATTGYTAMVFALQTAILGYWLLKDRKLKHPVCTVFVGAMLSGLIFLLLNLFLIENISATSFHHSYLSILIPIGLTLLRLHYQIKIKSLSHLGSIFTITGSYFLLEMLYGISARFIDISLLSYLDVLMVIACFLSSVILLISEYENPLKQLFQKFSGIEQDDYVSLRRIVQLFCILGTHLIAFFYWYLGPDYTIGIYGLILVLMWLHMAHYRIKPIYLYFVLIELFGILLLYTYYFNFISVALTAWIELGLFLLLIPAYHFYFKQRLALQLKHLYLFLTLFAVAVFYHFISSHFLSYYDSDIHSFLLVIAVLWVGVYLVPCELPHNHFGLKTFIRSHFFAPALILFFTFNFAINPLVYIAGIYVICLLLLFFLGKRLSDWGENRIPQYMGILQKSLQLLGDADIVVFVTVPMVAVVCALAIPVIYEITYPLFLLQVLLLSYWGYRAWKVRSVSYTILSGAMLTGLFVSVLDLFYIAEVASTGPLYFYFIALVPIGLTILRLHSVTGQKWTSHIGLITLISGIYVLLVILAHELNLRFGFGINNQWVLFTIVACIAGSLALLLSDLKNPLIKSIQHFGGISGEQWMQARITLQIFCITAAHVILAFSFFKQATGIMGFYLLVFSMWWFHLVHFRKKVLLFYFVLIELILTLLTLSYWDGVISRFYLDWTGLVIFFLLIPIYTQYLKKKDEIPYRHLYSWLAITAIFVVFQTILNYGVGLNISLATIGVLLLGVFWVPLDKEFTPTNILKYSLIIMFYSPLIILYTFSALDIFYLINLVSAYSILTLFIFLVSRALKQWIEKDGQQSTRLIHLMARLLISEDIILFVIAPACFSIAAFVPYFYEFGFQLLVLRVVLLTYWYLLARKTNSRIYTYLTFGMVGGVFFSLREVIPTILGIPWTENWDMISGLVFSIITTIAKPILEKDNNAAKAPLRISLFALPIITIAYAFRYDIQSGDLARIILLYAMLFSWKSYNEKDRFAISFAFLGFNTFILLMFLDYQIQSLQAYIIPVCITVLALVQIFRKQTPLYLAYFVRTLALLGLFGSTVFEILLDVSSPQTHLILLVLCCVSILAATIFKVRIFFYMGFLGLALDLVAIITIVLWLQGGNNLKIIMGSFLTIGGGLILFSYIFYKKYKPRIDTISSKFKFKLKTWE